MDPQTLQSLFRMNRLLMIWLVVLSVLLLVSFALNVSWTQAANDPPVRVFTASLNDMRGKHVAEWFYPIPLEISSDQSATVILEKTVTLSSQHKHTCLVTASAEVERLEDAWILLQFTLTKDSTNGVANHAAHRRVEFVGSPAEIRWEEVSTVLGFDNISGTHTFRFLGRRNQGSSAPASITSAGMLILCINKGTG